ncbi:MAG TPA: hypothetical protein VIL65_09490 [Beijerinckiaceae bacterium]
MTPIRLDHPAVEPVAVAELRAHLRLEDGAEDSVLATLIAAAREVVEARSRRVLIESRWRAVLPWRSARLALPLSPVTALVSVARLRDDGIAEPLPPELCRLDAASEPPRLRLDALPPGPDARVAVEFLAGYGAAPAAVPEALRLAVRLLAARWFEHRGDGEVPAWPADLEAVVAPFRPVRL